MAKIHEYNATDKLGILKKLQAGEGTREEIAQKYNINVSRLVKWRHRYELYGMVYWQWTNGSLLGNLEMRNVLLEHIRYI